MTSEYKVDRKGWAPGPWDDEPDRVEWRSETGRPCLIVRGSLGALCGYVAVEPGHPWYEKVYYEVDAEVHGGLTYGSKCSGHVCHVPAPGEPDEVFWVGFDCAHAFDVVPRMSCGMTVLDHCSYRGINYVKAECESLAKQATAAAGGVQ